MTKGECSKLSDAYLQSTINYLQQKIRAIQGVMGGVHPSIEYRIKANRLSHCIEGARVLADKYKKMKEEKNK